VKDWFYRLGRAFLNHSTRLYYRRIGVVGRELIPAAGPGILVANHPNSVTDAFLLASQLTQRKVNFIAKDSITRAPVTGWMARRFGVVGVARGMDYQRRRELARERNESAIATCQPRLLAGELLEIFGEGISTDARRLQMIRKGALRFGYAAEQAADFKLGLVWIPVGITYAAKQQFRSDVLIRVGRPFRLADLHRDPATNEAKVLERGTKRLQRDLESLIVNIEQEQLAGLIDRLTALLGSPGSSLASQFERQRHIARAVQYFNMTEPSRLSELDQQLRAYLERVAQAGLNDNVVRQRHPAQALRSSSLGLLRNGPLIALDLYGWANGLIPRWTAFLMRPLGRAPAPQAKNSPGAESTMVAQESLWGTFGGWIGAALAFPLQIYLVYHFAVRRWGVRWALAGATVYAVSLIPSWRLYVRRRDILREQFASATNALRFLFHAGPAARLMRHRRRVQRKLIALLRSYDAQAPEATP
jgi:1-acyl-sn-glycerol-3-phosphate acyltransferase